MNPMKDLYEPTINALGTINVEQLTDGYRIVPGIWHYKPKHSYLVRLMPTPGGMIAESTSLKNSTEQLTERMRVTADESGMVTAFNDAFVWLEEQTKAKVA